MIKYSQKILCKSCGKDISMHSFLPFKGHKVEDGYLCADCYKKLKEEELAEKKEEAAASEE